jgi:DNA-binding CsgD family transcriptional regulator
VERERKQVPRAALVTADAAVGDIVTSVFRRRGIGLEVVHPARVDHVCPSVVLIDLRSVGAVLLGNLPSWRDKGVQRVIAIGGVTAGTADRCIDAWVSLDASVEELIATATGTSSAPPRPGSEATSDLERLTPREREVMTLLLAGLRVEEMGTQLGIAGSTVRTHLQNVLAKLDVNSRAEAAAWALRVGLTPAEVVSGAVR